MSCELVKTSNKGKKCLNDDCATRPRFNFRIEKNPLYCKVHKKDGMEDIFILKGVMKKVVESTDSEESDVEVIEDYETIDFDVKASSKKLTYGYIIAKAPIRDSEKRQIKSRKILSPGVKHSLLSSSSSSSEPEPVSKKMKKMKKIIKSTIRVFPSTPRKEFLKFKRRVYEKSLTNGGILDYSVDS